MYQRPTSFKLLPDVIKNLLIINGLFFLGTIMLSSSGFDLIKTLGLYLPGSPLFEPYQLITHMFMHADFTHIFFNMFTLWMFGSVMENFWGGKRFLIYYMVTGLGAAAMHMGVNYWETMQLKQELLAQGYTAQELAESVISTISTGRGNPNLFDYIAKYAGPTVGASGAVFGILLAYGMMFPNSYIYLFFAIPVKVKYMVAGLAALELYSGILNDPDSNIAHFAHLGGMLIGYLLLKYWRNSKSYKRF
jgi:membrane associated rhomboid family serine protease